MVQTTLTVVFVFIAFLAMGSWAMFLGTTLLAFSSNRKFLLFRMIAAVYGVISWGVFTLTAFNVGTADGTGGIILQTYPALAFLGLASAAVMGIFLIDSVMRFVNTGGRRATRTP